jgi:hypothetical protein
MVRWHMHLICYMVLLKQAEACPFIETMVANTALNVLIVMTTIVMSYVYFLFGK